jgi:hypothetical protein
METPRQNTEIRSPLDEELEKLAAAELNRNYVEAQPEPELKREPIFKKRVLITWALVTLAVYTTVQVAKIAIRESFRQAAVYTSGVETTPDNREVIYVTPNGKLTIIKDRKTGAITIKKSNGYGALPSSQRTVEPPPKPTPPADVTPPATTAPQPKR